MKFVDCVIERSLEGLFGELWYLQDVDFSGLTAENVTNMDRMFLNCKELTTINFENLDTSNVTNMGRVFFGCSNLKSVELGNLDTSNVTNMWGMFSCAESLESLDLSKFNTSKVENMSAMFEHCFSLKELDLSNFDTSNVTDMKAMFNECPSLEWLDISNFDMNNADISGFIWECNSLKYVAAPKSMGVKQCIKLDMALYDQDGFLYDELYIDNLGKQLSNETEATIRKRKFGNSDALYWEYNVDEKTVIISGSDRVSEQFIRNWNGYAWGYRGDMFFPRDVEQIQFVDCKIEGSMWRFFAGLDKLYYIDFGEVNIAEVTNMSDMFVGCSNLQTIRTSMVMAEGQSIALLDEFYDSDLYESTGEYRTMNEINVSLVGKNLKKYADESRVALPDAVKYVIYSHTLSGDEAAGLSGTNYSLAGGTLPAGMELGADGELKGIPMETGEFTFTISCDVDGTATEKTFKFIVLDNADANVAEETDPGYEIVQPVQNFTEGEASEQTLVSVGEYSEFRDVYIDGVKLEEGDDYTSEAGSTRITIMSETFARFSQPGTHTIAMEFRKSDTNELRRATQNYYVSGVQDENNNDNDGTDDADSNGDDPYDSGSDNENDDSCDDDGSDNDVSDDSGENAAGRGTVANTPIYHTVVKGDYLYKISRQYNISLAQLMAWNPEVKNPTLIYPGQRFIVGYTQGAPVSTAPSAPENAVYDEVQKGDSLYGIARRNKITLREVEEMNPEIAKQKYIYSGQKIRVK